MMATAENAGSGQSELDLNRFYDAAVELTGYPPEIALFDPQLAGTLNTDWLIERAQVQNLADPAEVKSMIADGLIRMWTDHAGKQGFLPYSTRQIEIFKKLKETGRYGLAELQYVAESWGDYIEAVIIDERPYDDREVADFVHFQRRAQENLEFFEAESQHVAEHESPSQIEVVKQRLAEWQRVGRFILGKTEDQLSDRLRKAVHRHLFHLRWHDEFTRLIMAQSFEAKVLQGYSVQVVFNRMGWHAGETTLLDINWHGTFRRVSDSRQEGRLFPLRTPDFDVTEKGVELIRPLNPEQYAEMYLRQNMQEMFSVLEKMGDQIWSPVLPPIGHTICQECGASFNREASTQIYCGERCRKRAKNRRWREKDPERARQCQARYWIKSYGDNY